MRPRLVVIGASLGGVEAVAAIVGDLPASFGVPVAVVVHRGPDPLPELVAEVQRRSTLRVCEATDGLPLADAGVVIAPPGYHLLVDAGCFALSIDGPVHAARPSIDVLFASAAEALPGHLIGVLLTGQGSDGVQGLKRIRELGGLAIAQDAKDARARALPELAVAQGAVDLVLPLGEIGPTLARLCGEGT